MKTLLLAAASAALFSTSALAQNWAVDVDNSAVTANMTVFGSPVVARFGDFDATITLDPGALDEASIEAVVYSTSGQVRTADGEQVPEYQEALEGSSGLHIERFDAVRFTSTDIRETATGYAATGTLTLRDMSRDVVLDFTLDIDGDRAVAEGGFTLSRADWGLNNSSWGNNIGDDVELNLHIEATREGAEESETSAASD